MKPIRTGSMIALTSAALFASACTRSKDAPPADKMEARQPAKEAARPADPGVAPAPTAAQPEKVAKVHCGGVNTCKGQSGCMTEKSACAGQNGCKGQGWIDLPAEECQAKGGKVVAEK
jgi:hypothetical protein